MPTYDYNCEEHGDFEKHVPMADFKKAQPCPTCSKESKRVMRSAPTLDIEGMADNGCPGAFLTSGDRMTRRHRASGQDWSKD